MSRKMRVRLKGPLQEPEIITMKKGATIEKEVGKRLDKLSSKTPMLIQAQTGTGKTQAVSSQFIPWAKKQELGVLYICPRLATTIQAKSAFIKALGEMPLTEQLTDEGIRVLEQIGNVTVLTAQALHIRMQSDPDSLKKFGMVIFDEVHLLLDDASFISSTGAMLENFQYHFKGAIRIYLSATPEAMLPMLVDAESPNKLQVLRFPRDYGYVCPWFFQEVEVLVDKINSDRSSNRWLVYMPTITKSHQLMDQLTCSVRLLNRVEREADPEGYNMVLKAEKFEEKVCICTAMIDVGVNFKDPLLRNVVAFSSEPNTIIQFLGRKRRTPTEIVNLYVKCPTTQDLSFAITQNTELEKAVHLFHQDRPRFLRQHVLSSQDRDLRNWLYVDENGDLALNPLVSAYLRIQREHLEKLLQRAQENKGDCCFDKFVTQLLRIRLPDRSECWLDPRYSGEAKAEFERFLSNNVGINMKEDDLKNFCEQFRDLCVAAFGSKGGKDRLDRDWGTQKVINKLKELDNGYMLKVNSASKEAVLELVSGQSSME